ncbi:hypothetical protein FB451DRAFT_1555318, partial [Mycena latifolia]
MAFSEVVRMDSELLRSSLYLEFQATRPYRGDMLPKNGNPRAVPSSFSPDVIFVVLAAIRLGYLKVQPARVTHSTVAYAPLTLKGAAALFLVASTTVFLTFLVVVKHFKSITPSALVITYAFLKDVFSAVILRSSIQVSDTNTSTVLMALVTAAYPLLRGPYHKQKFLEVLLCEFPWNVLNVIMQSIIFVGNVIFILIPTPWLVLTVPFLGALYWVMILFYLRPAKQLQRVGAASKSPLYTLFSLTVWALGVENHFQRQNVGSEPRSVRLLRAFLTMISFIMATGLFVLVVGPRHSTNLSSLALASLTSIANQLNSLLMNLTGLENDAVAVSRIHEITTLRK